MPYITQQDLVDRFGLKEVQQLSDRSSIGAIDVAVVETAINDAQAEIDTYLAGKYTLPLVSVPTAIKRVACDMARYHLFDIRATDIVKTRYEDAIKFLRAVSSGVASLGLDNTNQNVEPTSTGVKATSNSRVFNDDSLAGY